MTWTYQQVKAADAALSPLIADPALAAAALNAQTVTRVQDIATSDARAVILVSGEWAAIKRLAGQALSGQPSPTQQDIAIMAAGLCIDTMTLTDTLHVTDAPTWTAVQQQMAILQTAGVLSSSSATAWTGLRNVALPVWQPALTAGDVQTARAQP